MGVLVSGPGPFNPALLPPMPPGPSVTNLDVTTLCALVSEVSHADPKGPELQSWAQRVTHWQVSTRHLDNLLHLVELDWHCSSHSTPLLAIK